ncbi:MAG: hypothetical protein ACREBI_10150 [Nitrosotalea sp.]
MSHHIISEDWAKQIAVNFLQQHHSVTKTERPVLKDGVWMVEVSVSEPQASKFNIKINSRTGHVLEYYWYEHDYVIIPKHDLGIKTD